MTPQNALKGLLLLLVLQLGNCLPEPGKWTLKLNSSQEYNGIAKNVYANTKIFIKIRCSGNGQDVRIGWLLRETQVGRSTFNETEYIFF